MQITDARIEAYIEKHTSAASRILDKVERETYVKSIYPRMISGKVQGKFLQIIAQMIQPTNILEIGTFTGYSAICLAEGLSKGGQLHTIEINEELKTQNELIFKEAGLANKITAYYGNALDIIPHIGIQFDLVFIDADKINYCNYYELSMNKLRSGGFILADNVLWSGKVLMNGSDKIDKDTQAVIDFNEVVQLDDRIDNVMIPLRDGLTLIRKK